MKKPILLTLLLSFLSIVSFGQDNVLAHLSLVGSVDNVISVEHAKEFKLTVEGGKGYQIISYNLEIPLAGKSVVFPQKGMTLTPEGKAAIGKLRLKQIFSLTDVLVKMPDGDEVYLRKEHFKVDNQTVEK